MKKIFSMILIFALALSVLACGEKADPAQGNLEEGDRQFSKKTLSLGIWGGNDAESAALQEVISGFEEKTGAKIELKTYTDINTQMQADFIGGTAPDVFYVDGAMFPFYSTLGVMMELDPEEMETDAYYGNLMAAFTAEDGKVYAIPKDVSALALYINTDLLEEAGFTLNDVPGSLEEMVDFLPELQARLDERFGSGKVTAMTYDQDLARNLHLLERNGASVADGDEGSSLSSEGVLKNLGFLMDLIGTGAYKTAAELGLGWNGEVFGTGKSVIMEEGNWVYGNLKQNYPDINFEVKDMLTYQGERSSMSFTVGYAINKLTKEPELAKEWVKYAGGEGMAAWCSGAGCLPSRPDVAKAMDVESDPVWQTHLAQIEYAVPWQKGTVIAIINSAYQNYLPKAVTGEMTLEEAMAKADKQANDEIANSR